MSVTDPARYADLVSRHDSPTTLALECAMVMQRALVTYRPQNAVMSHEDWLPTLLAAAGVPDIKPQLLRGYKAGDKTFKNRLDGYNFLPFFTGEADKGPRREFFYFDDNASLNAMRYDDWKIHFKWIEGNLFTGSIRTANVPLVVNLRQDPFERYPFESEFYRRWQAEKLWTLMPAQAIVAAFLQSFREFPPSQKSGSFTVEQFLQQLQEGATGAGN
jgi:arylsulfatase A-like enzyme